MLIIICSFHVCVVFQSRKTEPKTVHTIKIASNSARSESEDKEMRFRSSKESDVHLYSQYFKGLTGISSSYVGLNETLRSQTV